MFLWISIYLADLAMYASISLRQYRYYWLCTCTPQKLIIKMVPSRRSFLTGYWWSKPTYSQSCHQFGRSQGKGGKNSPSIRVSPSHPDWKVVVDTPRIWHHEGPYFLITEVLKLHDSYRRWLGSTETHTVTPFLKHLHKLFVNFIKIVRCDRTSVLVVQDFLNPPQRGST